MIEAWFSSSVKMTSSFPIRRGITARFVFNPDWTERAASVPLKWASFSSSSRWRLIVPAIERTAPGPTPYSSIARFAASASRGSLANPR